MVHVIAFAATFLLCLVYAFSAGGRPERLAMLAQLAALLLSMFAMSFRLAPIVGLPVGLALVDLLLSLALISIALKANRLWPIILAGLQVSTVLAHLAKVLSFPLPEAGYAIFIQFWAWPMLIVTAAGTYFHRERTRTFGSERDWKPLWPKALQPSSLS